MQTTTTIAQSAPSEMPTRLPIKETIKAAWSKVYGAKKVLFFAFLITVFFDICLNLAYESLDRLGEPYTLQAAILILLTVIVFVLLWLIYMLIFSGGVKLGIRRTADLPINLGMMFQIFHLRPAKTILAVVILINLIIVAAALPLAITLTIWEIFDVSFTTTASVWSEALTIVMGFISFGLMLFAAIRLSMALPLVLDRQISSIQAIKQSFHGTRKNFWRLLFFAVLSFLCLLVSVITIGIAGIWLAPFVYILFGTVYQKLFGITQQV